MVEERRAAWWYELPLHMSLQSFIIPWRNVSVCRLNYLVLWQKEGNDDDGHDIHNKRDSDE